MHSRKVSFISPIRDRDDQIPGLIHNIHQYYTDCEIILACQVDKKVFRHGQLRNLGYKKSTGQIVVFIDIDVRLFGFVDFELLQKEHNHSLLLFNMSQEIRETSLGIYQIFSGRTCTHCIGRLLCFTREQFEECGGYSNLCIGWSWEDNLLFNRAKCVKIPGKIGHVAHPYQRNEMKHVARNKSICLSDSTRDSSLDGFRQTVAKEHEMKKIGDNVFRYNFCDIGVSSDFKYMSIFNEIMSEEA